MRRPEGNYFIVSAVLAFSANCYQEYSVDCLP